jgi:flagellar basal body-associated protein FliL
MDKRTKGCLWIALGLTIVVVMVGVAVVAGAGFWIYQSFAPAATFVDQGKADAELATIRARFGNHLPLINTNPAEGEPAIRKDARGAAYTGQLQSLQVAAYDKGAGKLVRFSIPFWLLRLAPDGKMSLGDDALDDLAGRGKLTVAELEAFGPGLLVDEAKPNGDRVLVWTE